MRVRPSCILLRTARGQLLGVAFKVCVNDEGSTQLSVLVCEEEGGVVPAWHLHPLGPVRLAVRDVVGEEVGPAEDVQAVDAREALRVVPGSWGDETAQVFHQDVVSLLPVGQQEQVHVWSVAELGQAERVYDGVLVAEDVDRAPRPTTRPTTAFWASKRPMSPVATGNAMPAMSSSASKSTYFDRRSVLRSTGWRPARTAHTKHSAI